MDHADLLSFDILSVTIFLVLITGHRRAVSAELVQVLYKKMCTRWLNCKTTCFANSKPPQ